ncbi:ejaculatory bulb-specific protein 3 [Folsomia candida]|uniref:Ejaculatory bulb-specific protein 3 n=1 Tax=Folsomia candida TaxID=158441 RepID=A0A226F4F8_FOLCA|nr:ejaculatory bulb-specific protein 3 [Folsomia candida]OXA64659.1 Ejaculatory bulb-specific protein 3 [Folsomia candida]
MKTHQSFSVLATLVLLGMISLWSTTAAENSFRTKRNALQNFAIERALKDKGFVRQLINCVLDRGPCDGHGRQLRLMAPEIVRGQCPGCSKKLHGQIRRVISHVQRNFPQEWSEVVRRFLQYPQQQFQNVFGYH